MDCIFCKPDKTVIYVCKKCIKLPGAIFLIKGFIPDLIDRLIKTCEDHSFNSVYFYNQCVVSLQYFEKEILEESAKIIDFGKRPDIEYSKKQIVCDLIALRRTILLFKYIQSDSLVKIRTELTQLMAALKCYIYEKQLTFEGGSIYHKILAKDMEFIWSS